VRPLRPVPTRPVKFVRLRREIRLRSTCSYWPGLRTTAVRCPMANVRIEPLPAQLKCEFPDLWEARWVPRDEFVLSLPAVRSSAWSAAAAGFPMGSVERPARSYDRTEAIAQLVRRCNRVRPHAAAAWRGRASERFFNALARTFVRKCAGPRRWVKDRTHALRSTNGPWRPPHFPAVRRRWAAAPRGPHGACMGARGLTALLSFHHAPSCPARESIRQLTLKWQLEGGPGRRSGANYQFSVTKVSVRATSDSSPQTMTFPATQSLGTAFRALPGGRLTECNCALTRRPTNHDFSRQHSANHSPLLSGPSYWGWVRPRLKTLWREAFHRTRRLNFRI